MGLAYFSEHEVFFLKPQSENTSIYLKLWFLFPWITIKDRSFYSDIRRGSVSSIVKFEFV